MNARKIFLPARYYSTGIEADGSYDHRSFGYRYENLELDLNETVFFLIDVYGLGYSRGEPEPIRPPLLTKKMFQLEKEVVNKNISPALEAARKAKMKIAYVTNYDPGINSKESEFAKCMKRSYMIDITSEFKPGEVSIEFSKAMKPKSGEYLVKKQMYSGFFETCLDSLFRNLGAKNLICVGFDGNICLRETLVDAFYRNYRIILLRDCTLSCEFPETEKDLLITQYSIKFIEWNIGYSSTSKEFIENLKILT
ncbi:MAG: cysteine hydrolase [Actinobacteria bacterium]|nr:cysteine hydrolase [Actinomycetota bacterium]